jgi:hypothetical protein
VKRSNIFASGLALVGSLIVTGAFANACGNDGGTVKDKNGHTHQVEVCVDEHGNPCPPKRPS